MTTLDLDAVKARADMATPGPWGFNSYSAVFGGSDDGFEAWAEEMTNAGHTLDRYKSCPPCGEWLPTHLKRSAGVGDGCRHFDEHYRREGIIAWVPAHHGDTAIGRRVDDAEFIAHAREDVPALLARVAELEGERDKLHRQAKIDGQQLVGCLRRLDESRAEANALMAERDNLDAENTRFRKRIEEEIDRAWTYGRDVNAMRPVVDAAIAWRGSNNTKAYEDGHTLTTAETRVVVAVDVYTAQSDQDAPSAGLSATETAEQGEVEGQATPPTRGGTQADGSMIRHTHPNGFRSGQWATIKAVVPADGRECYLVEFPDAVTDFWAIGDPDEPYEFVPGEDDVTAEPQAADRAGPKLLGHADEPQNSGAVVAVHYGDYRQQEIWVSSGSNIGNWYPLGGERWVVWDRSQMPAGVTKQHPTWEDVLARGPVTLLAPAGAEARTDRDGAPAGGTCGNPWKKSPRRTRPMSTDPTGLDAAIEALLADDDGGPSWCYECAHDKRDAAAAAARIVAPHIRLAALNEAAEEAEKDMGLFALAAIELGAWLRERAERETT